MKHVDLVCKCSHKEINRQVGHLIYPKIILVNESKLYKPHRIIDSTNKGIHYMTNVNLYSSGRYEKAAANFNKLSADLGNGKSVSKSKIFPTIYKNQLEKLVKEVEEKLFSYPRKEELIKELREIFKSQSESSKNEFNKDLGESFRSGFGKIRFYNSKSSLSNLFPSMFMNKNKAKGDLLYRVYMMNSHLRSLANDVFKQYPDILAKEFKLEIPEAKKDVLSIPFQMVAHYTNRIYGISFEGDKNNEKRPALSVQRENFFLNRIKSLGEELETKIQKLVGSLDPRNPSESLDDKQQGEVRKALDECRRKAEDLCSVFLFMAEEEVRKAAEASREANSNYVKPKRSPPRLISASTLSDAQSESKQSKLSFDGPAGSYSSKAPIDEYAESSLEEPLSPSERGVRARKEDSNVLNSDDESLKDHDGAIRKIVAGLDRKVPAKSDDAERHVNQSGFTNIDDWI